MIHLIQLSEVDSTNTYLKKLLLDDPDLPSMTVVDAYAQTDGKGQKGNSWESNPGENLSCSIFLRPSLPNGAKTFDLNIIVSLAIRDVLTQYIPDKTIWVKWPNDLIVEDRKIAGVLIENEWLGAEWCATIIGIGLNVKQQQFGAYRPVATSMLLEGAELHEDYEVWHHKLINRVVQCLELRFAAFQNDPEALRVEYHRHLLGHRNQSVFELPSGERFKGIINRVHTNGLLEVSSAKGTSLFAFKEIKMLL